MFGILKLMTKSGRQSLVRDTAKEYLTSDRIAKLAADGVSVTLEAGADKMDDARCAKIAYGCNKGADALKHLVQAIDPNGEEGKKVSEAEKAAIQDDIRIAVESLITEDAINDAIDKVVTLIP